MANIGTAFVGVGINAPFGARCFLTITLNKGEKARIDDLVNM